MKWWWKLRRWTFPRGRRGVASVSQCGPWEARTPASCQPWWPRYPWSRTSPTRPSDPKKWTAKWSSRTPDKQMGSHSVFRFMAWKIDKIPKNIFSAPVSNRIHCLRKNTQFFTVCWIGTLSLTWLDFILKMIVRVKHFLWKLKTFTTAKPKESSQLNTKCTVLHRSLTALMPLSCWDNCMTTPMSKGARSVGEQRSSLIEIDASACWARSSARISSISSSTLKGDEHGALIKKYYKTQANHRSKWNVISYLIAST